MLVDALKHDLRVCACLVQYNIIYIIYRGDFGK